MKSLTDLENNKEAVIKDIIGGHLVKRKLENLGIRPGLKIEKLTKLYEDGPVIIKVLTNNSQVAVGFGMAKKIIVE